jgi:hypothetical protein
VFVQVGEQPTQAGHPQSFDGPIRNSSTELDALLHESLRTLGLTTSDQR